MILFEDLVCLGDRDQPGGGGLPWGKTMKGRSGWLVLNSKYIG